MKTFEEPALSYIPSKIDYAVTLSLIQNDKADYQHFKAIKDITSFTDEKIANWLNISVKTYRTYKKPNTQIKASIKEHALMTLSLIKHGTEVFGETEGFVRWLETENFYFDKKAPITFMHTGSGIKFIDDRLTGMEYGDNAQFLMEVFRIAKESFAAKLTASGSANRWNKADQFVIYTGSSRSLSTLELVVHRNHVKPAFTYLMMIISVADEEALFSSILQSSLPKNWRSISAYAVLQQIGSDWYKSDQSLILKVPSAVISQEYNYLINTKHPDFESKVTLVRTESYFWDERLV